VPCNPHVLQHLLLRFHLFFYLCSYDARRSDAACPATRTYYNTFRCAFTCFFICVHTTHAGQTQCALQNPHVLQHLSLRFHLFFICVHTMHAGQTQRALQNPHVLQHLSLRFHLFFICVPTTHAGQTQRALQNPHVLQHLLLRFHLFFYLCSYDARRSDAVRPATHTYYSTFCCAFTCFCICVPTTHAGQMQCALQNLHVLQHLSLRFHLFCICVPTTHAGQTQRALQPTRTTAPFAALSPVLYLCSYDARRSDAACPCNLHVQWQLLQCPTAAAFYM